MTQKASCRFMSVGHVMMAPSMAGDMFIRDPCMPNVASPEACLCLRPQHWFQGDSAGKGQKILAAAMTADSKLLMIKWVALSGQRSVGEGLWWSSSIYEFQAFQGPRSIPEHEFVYPAAALSSAILVCVEESLECKMAGHISCAFIRRRLRGLCLGSKLYCVAAASPRDPANRRIIL